MAATYRLMTLDSITGFHAKMQGTTSVAKDTHVDDTTAIPDMMSLPMTQPVTVRGVFHG